jgi:RNA polymerase sigma factor (sigma-70 family)
VLEREQEKTVEAALARLPEKERQIIAARFGTGGRQERTLRDAAREVGVTQEQARRLEARALERLSADDALADWRAAA